MRLTKDCKMFGSPDPFLGRKTFVVRWDSPRRIERIAFSGSTRHFVVHHITSREHRLLVGSVPADVFNAPGIAMTLPVCQELAIDAENVGAWELRWAWARRFCERNRFWRTNYKDEGMTLGVRLHAWGRRLQRFVERHAPKSWVHRPLSLTGVVMSTGYAS